MDFATALQENTTLQDALLLVRYVYNDQNREILIRNGVMREEESWGDYQRKLYQLLLRPNRRIREEIIQMRNAVHQRNVSIGAHIRTAGLLANDCERVSMVDQETLETIPSRIESMRSLLTNNTKDVSVYLSSDSDKALSYLREQLNPDYLIIIASNHTRGHTTGKRLSEGTMDGALLDLFVLSDCDALLITQGSGFSLAAETLSKSSVKQVIPVKRGRVECERKRSK